MDVAGIIVAADVALHFADLTALQQLLSMSSMSFVDFGVTTCLENLEMSGNLTAVREMSVILLKIRELSGKNLVREKLPKTVYCNLHICVHTYI